MRPLLIIAIVASITALAAGPVAAGRIDVKLDGTGDFTAIQPAVDAALNGDTVFVDTGTFAGVLNRDITFSDSSAVLIGAGMGVTIIDCEANGSGLYFPPGSSGWVARDFTIRNGAFGTDGGGIRIQGASPLISGVEVENCLASNSGGGIFIQTAGSTPASPQIQSCTIRDCRSNGSSFDEGGGGIAVLQATPTVTDCQVFGNNAANGAGIMLIGGIGSEVGGTYSANWIHNNTASEEGGGIGAISVSAALAITDNLVYENSALDGGGMHLDGILAGGTVSSNTVAENSAASDGSGLLIDGDAVVVERTIVAFNFTTGSGTNAIDCEGTNGEVNCSIIWNPGLSDVTTCSETDNRNEDPLFCGVPGSYDYLLQPQSPATAANSNCSLLIGAEDIGCGNVATFPTTWGKLKSTYH
jgi:hypothetical protein